MREGGRRRVEGGGEWREEGVVGGEVWREEGDEMREKGDKSLATYLFLFFSLTSWLRLGQTFLLEHPKTSIHTLHNCFL